MSEGQSTPVASVNPKPKTEICWFKRKEYVNADGVCTVTLYKALKDGRGRIRPIEDIICWYDKSGMIESIQYETGIEVFIDYAEDRDVELPQEEARDIAAG